MRDVIVAFFVKQSALQSHLQSLLKLFFMLTLNLNCYIGIHILETMFQFCAKNVGLATVSISSWFLPIPQDDVRTSYNLTHVTHWIMVHCVFTFHELFQKSKYLMA